MLRLWFGPSIEDTIDVSPLALETEHGAGFAVATDLAGNVHKVNFAGARYPVVAYITLPPAQLGAVGVNVGTLRERCLEYLESGGSVTAFVESTGLAYSLILTEASPALLADKALSELAARETIRITALVFDDGVFSDYGQLGSVIWRGRN
jgi:hypothetical protein